MNPFATLFYRTLPEPTPPRDDEGRFISSHRIAVRKKAIQLATEKGRTDLIQRLTGETNSSAHSRIMGEPTGGALRSASFIQGTFHD